MNRIRKEAEQRVESYHNGNRTQLNDWIGNSATRLLYVIDVIAGQSGTNEVRCFYDWLRVRRGI